MQVNSALFPKNHPMNPANSIKTPAPPRPARRGYSATHRRGQSMGLWLSESMILTPARVEQSVCDLARAGYGIVRLMVRNTNFTHRSEQVVQAVGRAVHAAHAAGLRVVLDCEPHADPVARDMGSLFPDAIGFRVVRADVAVVDGRFVAHIPAPPTTGGARADFAGVESVFFLDGLSTTRPLDLRFEHRALVEPYQNGFSTRDHSYTEGRPGAQRIHVHLSGSLKRGENGKLVLYVRFSDPRLIDFSSQGVLEYYDQLLECYREIPLDGVGWDEPATGGDWNQYLCGNAYLKRFEEANGYALSDQWYLLDERGITPESARVRLDYYRTLNEAVAGAQQHLFDKARKLFGSDLLFGTHHTWQGEGGINDYRAGAVDYFRLNDNMDAGYTDCWWWDIKSVCYAYSLASSLGRLTPSGQAEVNNWDTKPTNSRVEYHARLMTLLDITWFNIWYGEATDTCLYPVDYTWPTTVRSMNAHHKSQQRIGNARPVIEIAILHGWETVCAVNRADVAGAHKAFCLNTAQMLIDQNMPFDWVDTRLLASARVKGDRLESALGTYSILILPYAAVLPREAWNACRSFVEAGGKAVFIGPPPDIDTDGEPIREEFAQLMGMPVLGLEKYLAGIDGACTLPTYRPQQLDALFPLDGDRVQFSIEGEPNRIDNETQNAVYLTDLDPRGRLRQIIEQWLEPEVVCYSDTMQWRLYRDEERALLICIARQESQLRGLLRWKNHEIEFHSGKLAFVEERAGEITVAGEHLEYQMKRPLEAAETSPEASPV